MRIDARKARERRERIKHILAVTVLALFTAAAMLAYSSGERLGLGDTTALSDSAEETAVIATANEAEIPVTAALRAGLPTMAAASMPATEAATEPPRTVIERYAEINMSDDERELLAAAIYIEARNQSAEGQQAVAEVVFNRVIASNFPDSVHDVLYEGADKRIPQFSAIKIIDTAEPTQAQYDAIDAALYGPSVLPDDVVFFSRAGENSRVWGKIGDHVFCRQYIWE